MSTHVILNGLVHLYNVKAPFIKSGKSIAGALEYDPIKDKVKCHECGEWFESVGAHLRNHGLKRNEYKDRHGFTHSTSLESEGRRKQRMLNAVKLRTTLLSNLKRYKSRSHNRGRKLRHTISNQNKNGRCYAQLVKKIRNLGVILKRAPTEKEIKDRLHVSGTTIRLRFGSMANAMYACGLEPNKQYVAVNPHRNGTPLYDKEDLTKFLKVFYQTHQKIPTCSDHHRGLLPHRETFKRHFGSWRKALKSAHIIPRTKFEKKNIVISTIRERRANATNRD